MAEVFQQCPGTSYCFPQRSIACVQSVSRRLKLPRAWHQSLSFELQVVVKTELLNCLREEQKHSTLKKVSQCI